jgi:hypothetical protein
MCGLRYEDRSCYNLDIIDPALTQGVSMIVGRNKRATVHFREQFGFFAGTVLPGSEQRKMSRHILSPKTSGRYALRIWTAVLY